MPDTYQLIKDCLKGKPAAQRALYEQFAPIMLGVCYRYTKSRPDAEDVLQEGFIKVFRSLHQYEGRGEPGAWIRRIMVTTAINYLKKNSPYQSDLSYHDMALHPVSDDNPEVTIDTKELAELIRQLPPGYQAIFNLHAVEGYSHVDIGKMLGINEGTSRSQYARARALLINWLERQSVTQKKLIMPSHDFEKQVQQKMDELRLVPSEAVWEEVAKQIPSQKKRRRALIWWLLLPLLAGAGFGIYHINNHPQKTNGLSLFTPSTTTVTTPAATSNGEKQTGKVNTTGELKTSPATHPATANNNNASPAQQREVSPADHSPVQLTVNMSKVHLQMKKQPGNAIAGGSKAVGQQPVAGKEFAAGGLVIPGETEPADMLPAGLDRPGERLFAVGPVTASFDPVLAGRLSPESIRKADSAAALKKAPPPKKMEWVVTGGAGVSHLVSGLSLEKSNYASSSAFYSNPGGLNVTPGTNAGAIYYGPSDVRQGTAFNLGLSLRRDIGHRYSIEAGIAYSYYTTIITLGGKVDSVRTVQQGAQRVTSYYLNGRLEDYTNNYQFVEIPIRLRKQLGRSPVSINTGVAIGRLIGSNAMLYDNNLNIYYKNNSLFNKTQLNLSAGFDIRLWQKKPVSLELGPHLQFGATNLFSKTVYGPRHLFFGGLEMRVSFGKK